LHYLAAVTARQEMCRLDNYYCPSSLEISRFREVMPW